METKDFNTDIISLISELKCLFDLGFDEKKMCSKLNTLALFSDCDCECECYNCDCDCIWP